MRAIKVAIIPLHLSKSRAHHDDYFLRSRYKLKVGITLGAADGMNQRKSRSVVNEGSLITPSPAYFDNRSA